MNRQNYELRAGGMPGAARAQRPLKTNAALLRHCFSGAADSAPKLLQLEVQDARNF